MLGCVFNNKKSGIYCIYNIFTGKVYVGSAINFHRRAIDHVYFLNLQKHHSVLLQRAWIKYGTSAFEFQILEFVNSKDDLLDREQFWIDLTECANPKFGYNISPTAGSLLGLRQSHAAKEKKSKALKGIVRSPETRAKIAAANFGPKHSDETKRKISEAGKGRITSDATKLKLSQVSKGRRHSQQSIEKMRIIAKKRVISEKTRQALKEKREKNNTEWFKNLTHFKPINV